MADMTDGRELLCHCGTCTCDPNMTPAVRFDLSPAQKDGAIRDHLIALGWTPPGAQQPASVDEAPTWSRQQPTVPGIYGIRGFNLCRPASEQFEAVVVVREHGGELVCNLHESTSEDDLESWAPICDLDPDFEWRVFVPGWEQQGGRADG